MVVETAGFCRRPGSPHRQYKPMNPYDCRRLWTFWNPEIRTHEQSIKDNFYCKLFNSCCEFIAIM